MKVVYIAHPCAGADIERNRQNAARWCAWALVVKRVAPVADWIVLSSVLDEERYRELGLAADFATLECCDELWLVGGRVSAGMALEVERALALGIKVVDLTHMGYEAPSLEAAA